MHAGMAFRTKRDQVLFGVVAGMTPKLFVVDLQVRHLPVSSFSTSRLNPSLGIERALCTQGAQSKR